MKFEEALKAMREGKKVVEVGYDAPLGFNDIEHIDLREAMKSDWEIYEEPKWEPKHGPYYVCSSGEITAIPQRQTDDNGVTRLTRKQAEKAAKKMRTFNRLLAYVDEHAPDYVPDWDDQYEKKYYVYYDNSSSGWSLSYDQTDQTAGTVYMPKEVANELSNKLNNGRVEL